MVLVATICAALIPVATHASHSININTADSEALQTLTGIGPTKAEAIIEYRNANGSFNTIEEIQNVSGIGEATFANIKDHITVTGSSALPSDEDTDSEDAQSESSENESGSGKNDTISLTVPDNELSIVINAPTRAYVNQPLSFEAIPFGISGALIDSLVYTWNFGDMNTGTGEEPTHTFAYAGTYVVMIEGTYARHAATARHEVDVVPVMLTLTRVTNGDIAIQNDASYEVNLSNFTLRGSKEIVLPQHTILLAGGTLTVPRDRVGGGYVLLYDPERILVASNIPTPNISYTLTTPAPSPSNSEKDVRSDTPLEDATTSAGTNPESRAASVAASIPPAPDNRLVYLGLVGLLFLGALGVYVRRTPRH